MERDTHSSTDHFPCLRASLPAFVKKKRYKYWIPFSISEQSCQDSRQFECISLVIRNRKAAEPNDSLKILAISLPAPHRLQVIIQSPCFQRFPSHPKLFFQDIQTLLPASFNPSALSQKTTSHLATTRPRPPNHHHNPTSRFPFPQSQLSVPTATEHNQPHPEHQHNFHFSQTRCENAKMNALQVGLEPTASRYQISCSRGEQMLEVLRATIAPLEQLHGR
jgi:hypothetical protein